MADVKEIYCRKLGHYLTFNYCSREQGDLPCREILDCWKPYGLEKSHLGAVGESYATPSSAAKLGYILQLVSDTTSSKKP